MARSQDQLNRRNKDMVEKFNNLHGKLVKVEGMSIKLNYEQVLEVLEKEFYLDKITIERIIRNWEE